MRIKRSRTFRTLMVEWDSDRPRIILGLTGMDRPSVQWHLTGIWHRLRHPKERP